MKNKKILAYLDKIIKSNTRESSKRFSAIFALLTAFILSMIFGKGHLVAILPMWLGFAAGALGMSVYEKIKTNDNNK